MSKNYLNYNYLIVNEIYSNSMETLAANDVFAPFACPVKNNRLEIDPFADHPVVLAGKLGNFDIFTVNDKGQNILIP